MSSQSATRPQAAFPARPWQFWQVAVGLGVGAYLASGQMTQTLRPYHWFLLLALLAALFGRGRSRRFFVDWMPLWAFWLGYDRLRLLQPYLLARVWVGLPFQIERRMFGRWFAGEAPPHYLRAWLASWAGTAYGDAISLAAQWIYLSHLFIFPALMLFWWIRSQWRRDDRQTFLRWVRAFSLLHVLAIGCYLLLPVAPPWWVSLYGEAQPAAELLRQTDLARAMDGLIVQRMIGNAPMWFGAVPSLHGAYPVLFFLLAWRRRKFWRQSIIAVYGLLMWAATMILNQHYLIDLLAGALAALAAYGLAGLLEYRRARATAGLLPKPD